MLNNISQKEICELLKSAKRIAVVGISSNPNKISREIAECLVSVGYEVVGVNPAFSDDDINEINVYPKLTDIPFDIDIVNVFRRSEDIPLIIADVLEKNPKALWLQLGIRNDAALEPVIRKGITTIQDKCIYVAHKQCKSSVHD